jgi:N6-L-threonylcarbamoyladenine synthase
MILALETSCDETAVALFDPAKGLTGEWIHSQIALHAEYGGVVPDLATREHLRNIAPLLRLAETQAEGAKIDAVAVTHGPGLAACLAIGVAAAKAKALQRGVPVIGVNHLRGHAWSPFIGVHAADPAGFGARLEQLLPHLGLIVSGGNTLLFSIDRLRRIEVISSTLDDAAGEALDKGAKLLGLGYPGGPLIEKLAREGARDAFDFPRGIAKRSNLDFSFSGLKTSLRYTVEKMGEDEVRRRLPDLCASYQAAVIESLTRKTEAALEGDYASVGLSGGVANNLLLRESVRSLARRRRIEFLAAEPKHTGDNAGMIAFAAWLDQAGTNRSAGMGLEIDPGIALAVIPA